MKNKENTNALTDNEITSEISNVNNYFNLTIYISTINVLRDLFKILTHYFLLNTR